MPENKNMPENKKRRISSKALSLLFIVACFAAIMAYLFISGDVEQLHGSFSWPRSVWLIVGLVLITGGWLFEAGVLWRLAKGLSHPIPYKAAFKSTMVVQFFNNITPFATGGQPMQIWSMWRDGVPVGEASSIILSKFAVYQASLSFCCIVAVVFDYSQIAVAIGGWSFLILVSFALQALLLIGLVAIILKPRSVRRFARFIARLFRRTRLSNWAERTLASVETELDNFEDASSELTEHPRVFMSTALLTLVQLQFYFAIPYCVCRSLGVTPPLLESMACAAFVLMVSGIMPLPGASGGAEGSFALVFSLFFPAGTSVMVAILLWRIITFYFPVLAGAPFCLGAPSQITEGMQPHQAHKKGRD